ncbi:MAG: sodium:proton antiporter [Alicyclobacillus macrosporangiidus]|uniref:cation:proton antiporter n=1 Tax=Alicyclobacillus macrosporangiidus TaxID=392015 RepID=UPI0026ED738D|nr:sodium:proton antiporter [Alicyclobacillus macrosporangiidus]MCL6599245.1 sodium:proton antiporter [Alicyclobacillus macrosporangiidus]
MHSHEIELAQSFLKTLLFIFVFGTLGGKLAQRLHIPDVVVYVVVGIVIGPPVFGLIDINPQSVLYQVILLTGASFILFHGGMVTRLATLRSMWRSIALLSTIGVLVTACVVGVVAGAVFHIPVVVGLLLGAIVASTDPAALVPIFQKVSVRPKVAHTVISESAFTDATGAILTTVVLGLFSASQLGAIDIGMQFVQLAFGGILVGGVIGLVAAFLVSENDRGLLREFTPMVAVISVLASYVIAEWIHASGFMSVFAAGIVMGNAEVFRLTILEREARAAHEFIDAVGLKFRMLIFVLLGSQVDFPVLAQFAWPSVGVAIVFMFVARPLTVLVSLLPDRRAKWSRNEVLFLFWTRETGVVPAALVGIVAGSLAQYGKLLSAAVFILILATLAVQASTTPWVAKRLGLLEPRS